MLTSNSNTSSLNEANFRRKWAKWIELVFELDGSISILLRTGLTRVLARVGRSNNCCRRSLARKSLEISFLSVFSRRCDFVRECFCKIRAWFMLDRVLSKRELPIHFSYHNFLGAFATRSDNFLINTCTSYVLEDFLSFVYANAFFVSSASVCFVRGNVNPH